MPVRISINATIRIVPALIFFLTAQASTTSQHYRTLPCKTAALAPSCIRIHGRLWQGNGTPSTRLWQIGTHHIFGIYSNQYGFTHDAQTEDNEDPSLPGNIGRQRDRQRNGGFSYLRDVYADFDVCPLEPHIAGHMQAACIESATHVVSPKE
jgi:hypothetical protein